jgi:hypothetical protein
MVPGPVLVAIHAIIAPVNKCSIALGKIEQIAKQSNRSVGCIKADFGK